MRNNPGDVLARATFERGGHIETISILQQHDGVTLYHDAGDEMPPYQADFAGANELAAGLHEMSGVPAHVRADLLASVRT